MYYLKGERNVATKKLSRIHWPVAIPKAVEIIELAGQIEVDTETEAESDSESEEEGGGCFQEGSAAQEKVLLIGI